MPYKPFWFTEGHVLSINAPTCGINKDGHEQYIVDPETGYYSSSIDDQLWQEVSRIFENRSVSKEGHTELIFAPSILSFGGIAIPQYYDRTTIDNIIDAFKELEEEFYIRSIGDLINDKLIIVKSGHGSPSQDQRVGEVPYVKVSDLRSGQININPTNMIPLALAEEYWRGKKSKLRVYDLLSPARASKNIGEFCMLLSGQEDVVLTKEIMVIRCDKDIHFDQFYLAWALSLNLVREQWERIVFMQTNREDVGSRYREILLPIPKSKEVSDKYSLPFKEYYIGIEESRSRFRDKLAESSFKHEIYL